jgi:beta-glucosidase
VAGITNPSGNYQYYRENFKDSPGPSQKIKALYTGWHEDHVIIDPIIDVKYDEGVFVGYRWYESKGFSHFITLVWNLYNVMNTRI